MNITIILLIGYLLGVVFAFLTSHIGGIAIALLAGITFFIVNWVLMSKYKVIKI